MLAWFLAQGVRRGRRDPTFEIERVNDVQREVDARCDLLGAGGKGACSVRLVKIGKKFGMVWYDGNFGRPASDRIKRIGA